MDLAPLVAWTMVVWCTGAGGYCLLRCLRAPGLGRIERTLDASGVVKGLAMAVMALPYGWGARVPEAVWPAVLLPVAAVSFGGAWAPTAHRRHCLEHGVGYLAMVYMAVAMAAARAGMRGMAGMGGPPAGLPGLTLALALVFCVSAVLGGTRLLRTVPAGPAAAGSGRHAHAVPLPSVWARPLPDARHVVLAVSMAVMLLAM
ncbi:DUF5134 domain-containing protein [Streptacidiphilus carbonis]|uniref:DUF5134 domain-containing protein n=1 Tax=Streptacidiphilus carbonis TaxID=105422 RepID=UPI001F37C563|nr:DUF5134 domain-containing protein [Streptacidiphilus carbonis]